MAQALGPSIPNNSSETLLTNLTKIRVKPTPLSWSKQPLLADGKAVKDRHITVYNAQYSDSKKSAILSSSKFRQRDQESQLCYDHSFGVILCTGRIGIIFYKVLNVSYAANHPWYISPKGTQGLYTRNDLYLSTPRLEVKWQAVMLGWGWGGACFHVTIGLLHFFGYNFSWVAEIL